MAMPHRILSLEMRWADENDHEVDSDVAWTIWMLPTLDYNDDVENLLWVLAKKMSKNTAVLLQETILALLHSDITICSNGIIIIIFMDYIQHDRKGCTSSQVYFQNQMESVCIIIVKQKC